MNENEQMILELCLQAAKSELECFTYTAENIEVADRLYQLCVDAGYEHLIYRKDQTILLISQYLYEDACE